MGSSRISSWRRAAALGAVLALGGECVEALETDQYYAWNRSLADATDLVNAHVNLTLQAALDRQTDGGDPLSCEQIQGRVIREFRVIVFHPTEIWANNSKLLDRSPAVGEEERRFRKNFIYQDLNLFPMGEWMPPSPTISVADVRIGTDKIAHFFSEGHYYLRHYRKARKRGESHEAATVAAIRWGIRSEQRILGKTSSGVFSAADLEANYQGFQFLLELCDGPRPFLELRDGRWRIARDFDFREFVTPEWDESYQPSLMTRRAWRKVRPHVERYCPLLRDPAVMELRRSYRTRDRVTPTEKELDRMTESGILSDRSQFSIDAVCGS